MVEKSFVSLFVRRCFCSIGNCDQQLEETKKDYTSKVVAIERELSDTAAEVCIDLCLLRDIVDELFRKRLHFL